MDTKSEAQQLIEKLRNQRATLGDKTDLRRRLHYKRIQRPTIARMVLFGYTFVSGMLFSEVLKGNTAAMLSFIIIVVVMMITQLKE